MTRHPHLQPSSDPVEPATDAAPAAVSRRILLQRAGALGLAAAAGGSVGATGGFAASSALPLTPEQEEGPFYVAIEKVRKNITLGRPGVPLRLKLRVVTVAGTPIQDAACDIWQCDALGVYSDEPSQRTVGETWLRGVQFTDASGLAGFETIYPGHYQGRTTHIHVKVHIGAKTSGKTASGGHVSHTGQLLFDDAVSTRVYRLAPYTSDTAVRVLNSADHVYSEQGGAKARLTLRPLGSTTAHGYLGSISLVVDPSSTPAGVGFGG